MDYDADPIAFGTDGWRATLETFTEPRVRMVAQAVATYLREADREAPVAVGYDARESSPGFARAAAETLAANGFDVLLAAEDVPTPVVAWTVTDRDLSGAVVLTASHNPPEYNGIKFLTGEGAPALPAVTDALAERLAAPDPVPDAEQGEIREADFSPAYLDHAETFLDREFPSVSTDLDGLDVVYDAMHGSGRAVTAPLLERAGATVHRRRCERDPDFGGTPPEPTADRLGGLVESVRDRGADLGIANDGDADRLAVVTPERGVLDPNLLFAMLYDFLLSSEPGGAVRTVSTSTIVDRVAAAHGQSVAETAVGFKWVARAMGETGALVGGEESGGYGVTAHLRNKDGVLLGLIAATAEARRPIDERVDSLVAEHGEIHQDRLSVDCPDDRKEEVVNGLDGAIPDAIAGVDVADVSTVDGFKIRLVDDTWVLVRPSGTEPKLRIYAEAGTGTRVRELLEAARDLVEPRV